MDHLWQTSTLPLRKSVENHSIRKKKDFDCNHDFVVYPALLSKVAYAFKENMVVSTKSKDSITYHEVFDGRDAVVSYIYINIYITLSPNHYSF